MDSYARPETFLLTFTLTSEPLIRRDKDLKLEPALATKWGQTNPDTWFFDIRPGVKFHDGTPLTADDIVFSLNRPTARLRTWAATSSREGDQEGRRRASR
jgi:peptide/nickel transport system substrate-binding protein